MGMPAFNWIVLSHVILLLVPGVIAAITIIKAAVAATEVAVAVTIVCTILREAVLVTDIAEATPDGDLTHMTHHTPSHLGDTTTSHNLHLNLTDVNLIHAVEAGPDHPEEDMAIIPRAVMA